MVSRVTYALGTLLMAIGFAPFVRHRLPQRPLEVGVLLILAVIRLVASRLNLYPVRKDTTVNAVLWALVRLQTISCLIVLAEVGTQVGFERM